MNKIIVTGAAGFIGSRLVRLINEKHPDWQVYVVDKLSYAAPDLSNLEGCEFVHLKLDIADGDQLKELYKIDPMEIVGIMHLAAESHVDNSIDDSIPFVMTNVVGTVNLLEVARKIHRVNPNFKFYHISTDEVFGSLGLDDPMFNEETPYDPRSPYSASKAGSDHFVRAYHHTHKLPVYISNCSNNYGPNQHDEKLLPTIIRSIANNQPIPVYGSGRNVRDWLFVDDHCRAILKIFNSGNEGKTYCVGGDCELPNIEIVKMVCDLCDEWLNRDIGEAQKLITYVEDRKGHDFRYAVDHELLTFHTGWKPTTDIKEGLKITVDWYLSRYIKENSEDAKQDTDIQKV